MHLEIKLLLTDLNHIYLVFSNKLTFRELISPIVMSVSRDHMTFTYLLTLRKMALFETTNIRDLVPQKTVLVTYIICV